MKIQLLHQKAVSLAKTYLTSESDLIAVLQEIDACRGYRELKHESLFSYALSLGLSPAVASNLIVVARKSREVPMLQTKIRTGEVTLSNARTIAPVLTLATQDRWLAAASTLSKHQLEREIAKQNPQLAIPERVRPVCADRMELKLGISENLFRELRRAQEIVSSKSKKAASLEETIVVLAKTFLEREDPIEKAKRARPARKVPVPEKRKIPAGLRHRVRLRDGDRCTHSSDGKHCSERKWLDIHHVKPVSDGGLTVFENLTTLCRGHHQMAHSKEFESRTWRSHVPGHTIPSRADLEDLGIPEWEDWIHASG